MAVGFRGNLEDFEASRVLVADDEEFAQATPPLILRRGWRKRIVGAAFFALAAVVAVGTWRGSWKMHPQRASMKDKPEVKQDVQALSDRVWGYTISGLGTLEQAVTRQGESTAQVLRLRSPPTHPPATSATSPTHLAIPGENSTTDEEAIAAEARSDPLEPPLPEPEEGWIYPGNIHHAVSKIKSADDCARICAKETVCMAWTWGLGRSMPWTDVCYIRGRFPKQTLTKVKDDDFVSGMPTQVGRSIDVREPAPGQSLFCFSLIIPGSYELGLMQFQYDKETNIFGCDEYATYSSSQFVVAPGVETIKVDSNLKCKFGGEFGTALNREIFFKVWDVVFHGGRYKVHHWTVKADTDAVFFADRMRNLVAYHQEYAGGTYLNNCDLGLHGPLEAFSTLAVENWRNGRDTTCVPYFQQKCNGDCLWGEDMYMDQCLQLLRAYRIDDFNQLVEDHCHPSPDWATCQTTNKAIAAFHPFKDINTYKACMANALAP